MHILLGLKVVFYREAEFHPKTEYLIHALTHMGKEFRISFQLQVHGLILSRQTNILHFNWSDGEKNRIPGLWMHTSQRLLVYSRINGENKEFEIGPIMYANTDYSIQIYQRKNKEGKVCSI